MGILLLLLNNAVAYREKLSERHNNFQACFSTKAPFICFCNICFVKKFCSQNQFFFPEKNPHPTKWKTSCQQRKLWFKNTIPFKDHYNYFLLSPTHAFYLDELCCFKAQTASTNKTHVYNKNMFERVLMLVRSAPTQYLCKCSAKLRQKQYGYLPCGSVDIRPTTSYWTRLPVLWIKSHLTVLSILALHFQRLVLITVYTKSCESFQDILPLIQISFSYL